MEGRGNKYLERTRHIHEDEEQCEPGYNGNIGHVSKISTRIIVIAFAVKKKCI